MTPTEIISQDCSRRGLDAKGILATIAYYVKNKAAHILRRGNTLLLIRPISKEFAELHLFTMDKPQELLRSLPYFIKTIRGTQLKRVYGKAEEPGTTEMLRRAGIDVLESDLPDYNWMANV